MQVAAVWVYTRRLVYKGLDMSIDSIDLDQETYDELGWDPCELPLNPPLRLKQLGKTVVLAGENGSGKSRLLRLLAQLVEKQMEPNTLETEVTNLRLQEGYLASSKEQLAFQKANLASAAAEEKQKITDLLAGTEKQIGIHSIEVKKHKKNLLAAQILGSKKHTLVRLVPQVAKLSDPGTEILNKVMQLADDLKIIGNTNSEKSAPAYMLRVKQAAQTAYVNRRKLNQDELTPQEIAENTLHDLLATLLGSEVVVELEDSSRLKINGSDMSKEILSPGQQILFQFGCILHAQGGSLSECIVVMDEPETHLHPAALQEVIDKLRITLAEGQLWIATHSVPLIAHLIADEPGCLWFAEKGRFTRNGRSPERVLKSLMGKGDGAGRLHDFTLQIPQFAALNFSAQCLLEPGVAGPNVADEQTNQIARILEDRFNLAANRLRILDYGAGRGRLLPTLGNYADARDCFDYYAYDKYSTNRKECEREIASFYKMDQPQRYLNTLSRDPGIEPFHIVVMCNVLHEIDPDTWLELFGKTGSLDRILASNGTVLFVEDYGINMGERAHRYGFLLLDKMELSALFGIEEVDWKAERFVRVTSAEEKYKDRLTAFLVDRECMTRVSVESQRKAIAALKERMYENLVEMLEDEPQIGVMSGEKGRAYARASQLFVNASVWCRNHPEK